MTDSLEMRLAGALREIYRGLDIFHDELLQLSPKELSFLLILDEAGECRVKDLAGKVRLPLSTVSWTADRMVQKKLMSRKTDPSDRRAIILSIAGQGKKAIEKHRKIFDDIATVVVANLSREEMQNAVQLIAKVSQFFK